MIDKGLDRSWLQRAVTRLTKRSPRKRAATRILLLADAVGATQDISFNRPLAEDLESGAIELETLNASELGKMSPGAVRQLWDRLTPTHFVMSRYSGGLQRQLAALARESRTPILYHIDDDLFSVPIEIGKAKFDHYNNPDRVACLREAMEQSDLIYTSTMPLAEKIRSYGVETPVRPGQIYCSVDLTKLPEMDSVTRSQIIGYMGTSGHAGDLAQLMPLVCDLMEKRPALRFETFGTIAMPAELKRFGSRVQHHPPTNDYDSFLSHLAALNWTVGLAPLLNIPFNRCKANTKWVEYTFAGIASVLQDLPLYRSCAVNGGAFLASSPKEWSQAMEDLLSKPDVLQGVRVSARGNLAQHYSRGALRDQLLDVMEEATERVR